MTIAAKKVSAWGTAATLLLAVPLALLSDPEYARAQAPPSVNLGESDPAAPFQLSAAQRTAILEAVRQDKSKAKPRPDSLVNFPVSVGAQLPASIALNILPDSALVQAPQAKTVQYTVIEDQVVLVDPTNMRVVDIISP